MIGYAKNILITYLTRNSTVDLQSINNCFISLFSSRNLETISIGTCRLHGSPKLGQSTNVSPHHRLHHHHLLHMHHTHHSRVQSLDLMDDIPLPFQTDSHHLGLMNQDSPMLSPNPPPSVIDSNPPNLLQTTSTSTNLLATGQTTGPTHLNNSTNINNQINNISSNTSNFNSTTTTSTNVIINNIKTNTTTLGTTNPDSGNVHQLPSTAAGGGVGATVADDEETKNSLEDSCLRNRWHTCPELTKAMDGVTYIADHTKKEEESTRVRANNFQLQF